MKRVISLFAALVIAAASLSPAFSLTVSAEDAKQLPDGVVWVDQTLSSGNTEFTFLGEKYTAEVGKNAFATVSAAADACPVGGEIWLAPGNYSEGVTFKKNVTIKGPKAGIDPNLRGASVEDDWTLNPERGTGEAVLTTSWHMGVNAGQNAVYDCDAITVDGLAVSGAGMFRSNYGGTGKITLVIKNIYVYGYTTKNNGPFYSMSYYPDKTTNNYRRYLTLENIRVEGLKDATLIHTTCDTLTVSGVYVDSESNGKLMQAVTLAGTGTTDPAEILIKDCRLCQKVSPVINLDLTTGSAGMPFNSQIAKRTKVTATVEDCVFSANSAGRSDESIAIARSANTENVEFVIRNNTYLPKEADEKLPAEEKYVYPIDGNEIRFFGRTYAKSGAVWFNWCASGFEFSFRGSGASARIRSNAPGTGNNAFIKIYVDGGEGRSVELTADTQDVVLASGLDPAATHTVRVVKRTNSRSSTAGLAGLWIADGEKAAAPSAPSRLIEFVGDSLTGGYASIADVVGNTSWSTAGEDCTETYARTVAEAFGADYDVIAVSGRGVVNNYGGSTELLIPVLYKTLDGYNNPGVDYSFGRKPDVIVINIGTNDASASVPANTFREKFTEYLREVRALNPDAFIIVGYGLTTQTLYQEMSGAVKDLTDAGDGNIEFIRFATLRSKYMALGHPLASGYADSAKQITEAIEKKLGWKAGAGAEEETTAEVTTAAETAGQGPDTTSEVSDGTSSAGAETTGAGQTKKGCGSSAAGIASAVAVTAAALTRKKRKEE
ncbi:MAG: hypothetical protein ILO42_08755 [Clostridia bacterium]|nr:hypothetical protein [Clostridia bacterium]